MLQYRIIMQLQIPRQQHWVHASSGLNAISSTHCATDSVSCALCVIRPLVLPLYLSSAMQQNSNLWWPHLSPTLFNNISKSLDKESKDFQAREWAPSFLQQPLSANVIVLEAWEEETEGWTRCGINIYNRLLLWLFPPISEYLSMSQNAQVSTTLQFCCSAGSWMAPELSVPELRRTARWHHGPGRRWGQKCNRWWQRVAQLTAQN